MPTFTFADAHDTAIRASGTTSSSLVLAFAESPPVASRLLLLSLSLRPPNAQFRTARCAYRPDAPLISLYLLLVK